MADNADAPDRQVKRSAVVELDVADDTLSDSAYDEAESVEDVVKEETEESSSGSAESVVEDKAGKSKSPSSMRQGLLVGLVVLAALGCLVGWLSYRGYQAHQAQQERQLFLQVGRQGALNLTTIDYTRVDADIQRVLDSSTGTFHDDFQKRSPAFAEVVKQAQSKSVGSITEAGIESLTRDSAQVLVTVLVRTSNIGAQEQEPRHWRMRISVQKVGDEAKVSSVGFVP